MGQVPHIPLENRRDIGVEPGHAAIPRRPAVSFRIPSTQDAFNNVRGFLLRLDLELARSSVEQEVNEFLAMIGDLPLRERPQTENLHPAGQ